MASIHVDWQGDVLVIQIEGRLVDAAVIQRFQEEVMVALEENAASKVPLDFCQVRNKSRPLELWR